MNESKGWICAYRKIEDNAIVCKDNDYFRVWHHLLYNATHKPVEVIFGKDKIILKPGQLITGREAIAKKCKVQESKVTRILKAFKNEQQIEQQTCTKGTLITILNWEEYQQYEQEIEQRVNNERTTNEQRVNTNNNVTIKQCNNSISIYEKIEGDFGRTLASIEFEKINSWIESFSEDIVSYAFDIAVLNNVKTFKYVEGILDNWKSANYKTLQEIKDAENKIPKIKEKDDKPFVELFDYNWLDEEFK